MAAVIHDAMFQVNSRVDMAIPCLLMASNRQSGVLRQILEDVSKDVIKPFFWDLLDLQTVYMHSLTTSNI